MSNPAFKGSFTLIKIEKFNMVPVRIELRSLRSSSLTNIIESARGQGALNIMGYTTDFLDYSVVTSVDCLHQEQVGRGSIPT